MAKVRNKLQQDTYAGNSAEEVTWAFTKCKQPVVHCAQGAEVARSCYSDDNHGMCSLYAVHRLAGQEAGLGFAALARRLELQHIHMPWLQTS